MKKSIKKLNLNKQTISNLTTAEMNRQVGAGQTNGHNCTNNCTNKSCDYTCHGTCRYSCGGSRCD